MKYSKRDIAVLKAALEKYNDYLAEELQQDISLENVTLSENFSLRMKKLFRHNKQLLFMKIAALAASVVLLITATYNPVKTFFRTSPSTLPPTISNTDESSVYNLPVTKEPFEDMEIVHTLGTYITFDSEEEIYADSELVFIGMPVDTFTEGTEIYYTFGGKQVEKNSGERITNSVTLRNVKILEMIKGEYSSDTIKIADRAITKTYDTGETKIVGLPSKNKIEKKNAKYIFYVYKSGDPNNDYYYSQPDDGVINIDMLHQDMNKAVDSKRLEQVKTRFSAYFEKYDRSEEIK